MTIAGKWIVECAELESLKGNSVERLKAFLSREVDRYRPPYGRHSIDSKRQCVFCGTTNNLEYLRDLAGNRRYWPVRASTCDTAAVTRDRDQLWAEAKARFDQGENWWLAGDLQLAQIEQAEERMEVEIDPWEDQIASFSENATEFRTQILIFKLFNISELEQTKSDQKRVAAILRKLGFKRIKRREGNRTFWAFIRETKPLGG
jgi:predicted P-loop ATPase